MALRGLGTLQALLGRDVTKRRKLANGSSGTGATASSSGTVPAEQPSVLQPEQQQQHKQHKQSSGTAAAAAEAPANAGLQRQAAAPSTKPPLRAPAARSKAGRPVSPLKQGNVRCPVCDRQLPNDDTKVNAHVGKLALSWVLA